MLILVNTGGNPIKNKIMLNLQWADELLENPKNLKFIFFKDNIWGADVADMWLISKYNKGIWFLLCVTDIFSKSAWVFPLKNKKGITISHAF